LVTDFACLVTRVAVVGALLRRAAVFFRGAADFLALDPFALLVEDPRLAIAGPRLAALFLAGALLRVALFFAALFRAGALRLEADFAPLLRAADLPADLRAGPLRAGPLRAGALRALLLAPVDLRLLLALLEPRPDDFLAAAMFHAPII